MIRWIERIAGVFDHLWSLQILSKISDFDRKNLTIIRVFAKAEFTNPNVTKKVRILFVESEVEVGLRKRNRFSTKYLGGDNLWSRSTKFENIVEFVTFILWNSTIFLDPTYFLPLTGTPPRHSFFYVGVMGIFPLHHSESKHHFWKHHSQESWISVFHS